MSTDKTKNLGLNQPEFNEVGWHDDVNQNFDKIDEAITTLGYPNTDGVWAQNTAYDVNDRLLDDVTGVLYECLVAHTSSSTNTFAQDRAAHPSYWVEIRSGFVWRGGWITGKAYRTQDAVTFDGQSYICLIAHTSGTFASDLAALKWELFAAKGTGGTGSGDTNGPGSAVDGNAAVFDGGTGKQLKDSGINPANLAPKNNPTLTGNVNVPTASPGNNTTLAASTAFVTAAITAAVNTLLGGVSSAFDTLSELAAGLANKLDKTANLTDVANAATAFNTIKQGASTSTTGVVELATDAETLALADTARTITPSNLAAFLAAHPSATFTKYTTSTTWNKPAGGIGVIVRAIGGGGVGGKGDDSISAGGGGGGSASPDVFIPMASLGSTESITIGAAIAGRTTAGDGSQGNNSSFGSWAIGYGGGGGRQAGGGGGGGGINGKGTSSTGTPGGAGGVDFAGTAPAAQAAGGYGSGGGGGNGNTGGTAGGGNWGGGGGGGGTTNTGAPGRNGGDSMNGGGGGGGAGRTVSGGLAGTSKYGGNGGNGAVDSANATDGAAPGGGGGGSENGNSGGGARGEVWVWVL